MLGDYKGRNGMTRSELQTAYINALIESFALDDLKVLTKEYLEDKISLYSDFELDCDIKQFTPHLLENTNETN